MTSQIPLTWDSFACFSDSSMGVDESVGVPAPPRGGDCNHQKSRGSVLFFCCRSSLLIGVPWRNLSMYLNNYNDHMKYMYQMDRANWNFWKFSNSTFFTPSISNPKARLCFKHGVRECASHQFVLFKDIWQSNWKHEINVSLQDYLLGQGWFFRCLLLFIHRVTVSFGLHFKIQFAFHWITFYRKKNIQIVIPGCFGSKVGAAPLWPPPATFF